MPPPSKIDQLPPEVRAALDQFLIAAGFGNIVQAAEWLTELGHPIGKSSVGAYNQKLKQRIAAIKASTEAAKLIVAAAPDEAADRTTEDVISDVMASRGKQKNLSFFAFTATPKARTLEGASISGTHEWRQNPNMGDGLVLWWPGTGGSTTCLSCKMQRCR